MDQEHAAAIWPLTLKIKRSRASLFADQTFWSRSQMIQQATYKWLPLVLATLSCHIWCTATNHWPFYPGTCNIETLSRELTDVNGSEWFNLGTQLGVKDFTLRDIEANHRGDVQRCKREMLRIWLQSGPKNPWKTLAAALESIGRKVLAQRILQLGKCNTILPRKVKGTMCCVKRS